VHDPHWQAPPHSTPKSLTDKKVWPRAATINGISIGLGLIANLSFFFLVSDESLENVKKYLHNRKGIPLYSATGDWISLSDVCLPWPTPHRNSHGISGFFPSCCASHHCFKALCETTRGRMDSGLLFRHLLSRCLLSYIVLYVVLRVRKKDIALVWKKAATRRRLRGRPVARSNLVLVPRLMALTTVQIKLYFLITAMHIGLDTSITTEQLARAAARSAIKNSNAATRLMQVPGAGNLHRIPITTGYCSTPACSWYTSYS